MQDDSHATQLVSRTARTQDNSIKRQLAPKTTCAQDKFNQDNRTFPVSQTKTMTGCSVLTIISSNVLFVPSSAPREPCIYTR